MRLAARMAGMLVLVLATVATAPWPAGGGTGPAVDSSRAVSTLGAPAVGPPAPLPPQERTTGKAPGQCWVVLVLDTLTAPPEALSDWRRAAREFSRMTHLQVTVRLGSVPNLGAFDGGPGYRRVAVVYAPDTTVRPIVDGQSVYAFVDRFSLSTQPRRTFAGAVMVNTDFMNSRVADAAMRHLVLLHELGHIAGLAHSPYRTSLMYAGLGAHTVVTEQDRADLRRNTARCASG